MTFRIEEKLLIIPENKFLFFKWLKENNAKKLFSDRVVSSTYFDNDKLSMFCDTEEGIVPRKKLRLRSYSLKPHATTKTYLETKITSAEGRYKISNPTTYAKKYLKYGIFDKDYGACFPKIRITYLRSYYSIKNVRLTFDRNINYRKVDIWNLGIIFFILLSKGEMLETIKFLQPTIIKKYILENEYEFLQYSLNEYPEQRLEASELIELEYLK